MNKAETKALLQIVSALYPNWKPENLDLTVGAWTAVLEDENAQEMADALKRYARNDKSGFAPSVGQLLNQKPIKYESAYAKVDFTKLLNPPEEVEQPRLLTE